MRTRPCPRSSGSTPSVLMFKLNRRGTRQSKGHERERRGARKVKNRGGGSESRSAQSERRKEGGGKLITSGSRKNREIGNINDFKLAIRVKGVMIE